MKDIIPAKKQSPILGLSGMGGGVGSNLGGSLAGPTYVDDVFSTYLWEGNATTRDINNGIDFAGEGGLVWIKNRENSNQNNLLFDTTAPPQSSGNLYSYPLQSNTNIARGPSGSSLKSFNSNGFSVFTDTGVNENNKGITSWNFRKAKGFFDIQTWSGNSTAGRQISHDLETIPGCIMVKRTNSASNWVVYHRSIGNNRGSSGQDSSYTSLQLNSTNGQDTSIEYWNNTLPTKDNFTLGIHPTVNQTGGEYVAYIFAHGDTGAGQYTTGLPTSHVKSPNGVYTAAANPPTMSTGPFGVANTALTFNGTTPHPYTVIASPGMNPGSQNYTYECWFKGDAATWSRGWSMLMSRWQDNGIYIGLRANGQAGVYESGSSNSNFNLGWTQDTWHHLAVVRDGGVTRMYLDGTQKGSFTNSQNYDNKYANLDIGSSSTSSGLSQEEFSGQMSNVRVVIGQAIYAGSSNTLTVPTSKLTLTSQGADSKKVVFLGLNGDANPDYEKAHKFGEDEDGHIIKCGSYVGASEINVICGFEPQLLFIKAYTNNSNGNCDWLMIDSMRGLTGKSVDEAVLRANRSNNEANYDNLHMSVTDSTDANNGSLGFMGTGGYDNSSNSGNGPYLYIAIRRPDGYVGKPASAGTDVFAMDAGGNTPLPSFAANFPVDYAFTRDIIGSAEMYSIARLLRKTLLVTQTNAPESTSNAFEFDYMHGCCSSGLNSNFQAWMWKRGQGMDVVSYSGNQQGGRTIPHSLNKVPEMMWLKNRTSGFNEDWQVYHKGLNGGVDPEDYAIRLDTNGAQYNNINDWQDTPPTSTHFTIGSDGRSNRDGSTYITMLWSSVTGISKVGYYNGSNSTQTITTGFQPRFVILKRADATGHWYMLDTTRGWGAGADQHIQLNELNPQSTFDFGAPTTTGFTLTVHSGYNVSGGKYIYYAHA